MSCIGFAVYCHKIKFLRKLMGGEKNIKMFLFKFSSLGITYVGMDRLMNEADD